MDGLNLESTKSRLSNTLQIQSTPLNRVTSVRGYFDPIKRRTLLTENIFVLASMCESYSGPAKSGPIKRLTRLNSDPIKRSRLYFDSVIDQISWKLRS